MEILVLLLALAAVAAVFFGIVYLVRRIGARYPARERDGDTMLRDGVILAVLIPVIGLLWSARLFAKDRYGHGLAVLTVSGTMIVAYLLYAVAQR
jgi:hypothetical protein